ncbi:MAG TPA: alpha-hydroxy-acid oxidizing protein, partial [Anaerolineales bacterium]|nr:alpha-hydroxy-acid oxidizing protein [Anaerolineales bacterium]
MSKVAPDFDTNETPPKTTGQANTRSTPSKIDQRKADHIKINLEKDVRSGLTTGLEKYRFLHEALPELDLEQVDTSLSLFGKKLAAPILISSMTGGTADAESINLRLAEAAQEVKIAMGV